MEQKKKLSSGRWLIMFVFCIVLITLLVAALNFVVDPYGAFGDRVLQWWSYDETLNPRMAKLSYLEQHHGEYDSYIVGSSGSSSYPVEALNSYLGANFYNCFFYGSDMKANEEICNYLIENYEVKNLLLNLSPKVAVEKEDASGSKTKCQYYKVSGESALRYYTRFLLANPMDSFTKLKHYYNDGYVQQFYRVFNAKTGAYDKSKRDAEPIGDLDSYLARSDYAVFLNYPHSPETLDYLDEAMERIARIVKTCEQHGVNLIVTCQPCYCEAMDKWSEADWAAFRNALAAITDYWDFSYSSVSFEPRYFYDETHFRNGVGAMALAKIFDDADVYVPDDFGEHILHGSTPGAPQAEAKDESEYTAKVPILLYHDVIDGDEAGFAAITVDRFEEHMDALAQAGYTTVSFDDISDFITKGTPLPDKPIVITFDDGYESNYQLAYPILKQHGFKATIYTIGVSVGKDTYKDTGIAMSPHFSLAQAEEMTGSGLITVASHGYDIHTLEGVDPEPYREGVTQFPDESELDYVRFLQNDALTQSKIEGIRTDLFSYPFGKCNETAEIALSECGVRSTVTINPGMNTLVCGLQNSLHQMRRYIVKQEYTADDLIAMLEG